MFPRCPSCFYIVKLKLNILFDILAGVSFIPPNTLNVTKLCILGTKGFSEHFLVNDSMKFYCDFCKKTLDLKDIVILCDNCKRYLHYTNFVKVSRSDFVCSDCAVSLRKLYTEILSGLSDTNILDETSF